MEMEKLVSHRPASERSDGLRVLVVDNDLDYLLQLADEMLQSCRYHVTACGKAKDALCLLRDEKKRFDIVVADIVDMVDMDGFDFLATLTAEFKSLPIVIMSSVVSEEEEERRVIKGMEEGACGYFAKPISMECMKLLWQYVVRERIRSQAASYCRQSSCSSNHLHIIKYDNPNNNSDNDDDDDDEAERMKKNKKKKRDCDDHDDETNQIRKKKPRVCWRKELSDKFEIAIKLIRQNHEEVVPKKILECMEKMGVKGLTRQNISSHLQKVRASMDKFMEMEAPTVVVNHRPPFSSSISSGGGGGGGGGGGASLMEHSKLVQWCTPMNMMSSSSYYSSCTNNNNNLILQSSILPPAAATNKFFCGQTTTTTTSSLSSSSWTCSDPSTTTTVSLNITDHPSLPIFIPNDTINWDLDHIFSTTTT